MSIVAGRKPRGKTLDIDRLGQSTNDKKNHKECKTFHIEIHGDWNIEAIVVEQSFR